MGLKTSVASIKVTSYVSVEPFVGLELGALRPPVFRRRLSDEPLVGLERIGVNYSYTYILLSDEPLVGLERGNLDAKR